MGNNGNSAQLQPFTKGDPRAVAAGKKSVEVRRQRAIAEKAAQAADASTLAGHLATFSATFQRDDLGQQTAAVAAMILAKLAAGQVPIRHAGDAAELLKVLVDITRLEEGQSTSNVLHGSVQIVERIEAMRAELTASRDAGMTTTIAEPSTSADIQP